MTVLFKRQIISALRSRGAALLASMVVAFVATLATTTSTSWAQAKPRPDRHGRRYAVKIDSSPQQATIYLDDKLYGIVGYTPYATKLAKGEYRLIVELPGYKAVERQIAVNRGSGDFFVLLEREVRPGTVDVQAAADPNIVGAEIFLDGQSIGTAPLAAETPIGRHLVEVKRSGFTEHSQWVTVREGERVTLAPVLRAIVVEQPKGSLLVEADVADAEVFVDGKRQPDTTPALVDGLDDGIHVVEVRKPPTVPWKQTVYVKGGQRAKVVATLATTIQQVTGGNIKVVCDVEGAEVWLDGELKGKTPVTLESVASGSHRLAVKVQGYTPFEDQVSVDAGSATIVKASLTKIAAAPPPPSTGLLKIVSPVPEAKVFIDGASAGTVPVEREVPAGEHFVTVQQTGYAVFEEKVQVAAGQVASVTAALRAIGSLRFLSSVDSAEVVLDGEVIGRTPLFKEDIDVGEHVVTVRKDGYFDFEETVRVEGGKAEILNANMRIIDTGPTPEDVLRIKRGLSSFGARTMPLGHFSLDGGVGYPYWVEFRATVGVKDNPMGTGFDVGVGFRSYLVNWQFLGTARYRLFQRDPFAFAVFASLGGGGGFNGTNTFTTQAGALASITFRNLVTVTGRAYLDLWSDQLCGEPEPGEDLPKHGPGVCTNNSLSEEERERATRLVGVEIDSAKKLQERDWGLRAYLSLIVEAALHERLSLFFVFEGAPGQDERAAHTKMFTETLPLDEDPIYNGKVGVTAKF
ncbi:MAG: PEGA domain-containing protein [Pseudomonadota bacterium]